MGESDSYYNPNQGRAPPQPQYGDQNYGYQQAGYNAPPPPPQQQPPMNYQQPPPGPPQQQLYPPQDGGSNGYGGQTGFDEKHSFEQTFKIEKPKWNDLWAGVLVGPLSTRRSIEGVIAGC